MNTIKEKAVPKLVNHTMFSIEFQTSSYAVKRFPAYG